MSDEKLPIDKYLERFKSAKEAPTEEKLTQLEAVMLKFARDTRISPSCKIVIMGAAVLFAPLLVLCCKKRRKVTTVKCVDNHR